MKATQWLTVLGLIVAESGAQYFLQKGVSGQQELNVALGCIMYVLVACLYFALIRSGDPLAVANSVWNAGTEISIAVLGWVFFGQKLTGIQLAGIGVTIAGINMLGHS